MRAKPAPISYICFNRPQTVDYTLKALCDAELAGESDLHVFIDAPRHDGDVAGVLAVRELCKSQYVAQAFSTVTIHEREFNLGCPESLRQATRYMAEIDTYSIFIEDDVLISPHTLMYLNTALQRYEHDPAVFCVSTWRPPTMRIPEDYRYDAWFSQRIHVWGWASWSDRLLSVDWTARDAELLNADPRMAAAFNQGGPDMTSMLLSTMQAPVLGWDIVMDFSRFKQGKLCLVPTRPYSMNIGTNISSIGSESLNLDAQRLGEAPAVPRLPDFIIQDQELLQEHYKSIAMLYQ